MNAPTAMIASFLAQLKSRAPWAAGALRRPGVLALVVAVVGVLWLREHDGRVRRGVELEDLKRQTSAEVSKLERQAAAAAREARERQARALAEFHTRRVRLERDADTLRRRLAALEGRERAGVDELAALPAAELARRVASALGPASLASDAAAPASHPALGTGDEVTPLGVLSESPSSLQSPAPGPVAPGARATLSERGWRQVAAALIERDACHERAGLLHQLVENCRAEVEAHAAPLSEQSAAIQKLDQALEAEREIRRQRDAAHRAELRAARGTLASRFFGALKYLAAGVAIGVVAR